MGTPNEPAFPRDHLLGGHNGLTQRQYFAGQALAGLLANPNVTDSIGESKADRCSARPGTDLMPWISRTDERYHRVRLEVPCEDTPALLENVYEEYTLRTTRLLGVPIWVAEVDVQRRPIMKVFG